MSTKYKFNNREGIYFVSFAVVGWIGVFTRQTYRDVFLDSTSQAFAHAFGAKTCASEGVVGGDIQLIGNGPYKGKTFQTTLKASEYLK